MGVEDKWHKNRIFHQSIHLTINDMNSKRWKMEDRNAFRGGEEKSGWEMKDTKRKKERDRERVKRDEKKR